MAERCADLAERVGLPWLKLVSSSYSSQYKHAFEVPAGVELVADGRVGRLAAALGSEFGEEGFVLTTGADRLTAKLGAISYARVDSREFGSRGAVTLPALASAATNKGSWRDYWQLIGTE